MNEPSVVFSSSKLPSHAGGKLLELPRQKIGWEWMSFYVTRLQPGEVMRRRTEKEESSPDFLTLCTCRQTAKFRLLPKPLASLPNVRCRRMRSSNHG